MQIWYVPCFSATTTRQRSVSHPSFRLFSDLDGTWLSRERIPVQTELTKIEQPKFTISYITGRTPGEITSVTPPLSTPEFCITHNGAAIFKGFPYLSKKPLVSWDRVLFKMLQGNSIQALDSQVKAFAQQEGLIISTQQPVKPNDTLRAAYTLQIEGQDDPRISKFKTKLENIVQKPESRFQFYIRKGPKTALLVLIPKGVDKEKSIEHVIKRYKLEPKMVVIAGNDTNDVGMMSVQDGRFVIAVGPDKKTREHIKKNQQNRFLAHPKQASSRGILVGIRKFIQKNLER